ncbi:uncharacterized protein LACBIDRAFT_308339 [Laccaria bicolor S238N-H82]|uniref:Predicted protein n=1 Tax=Laccaria bicolor (strain S238N-H82 / ATCC MYA-4686) TaxID=486041 RepID=B0DS44_LACBS|nr:uncharacterized protein LACBIDRAFT_308339 [Laccaria bicolor S238N-H82]EDR02634.1 predicted protein [Laccaria bicolor S238N-H82]|eukprot:XP_001886678.1 predicted protein [Laccaria bicolor S238N-H82]
MVKAGRNEMRLHQLIVISATGIYLSLTSPFTKEDEGNHRRRRCRPAKNSTRTTSSATPTSCKHALAQAAVTCKTFLEPALDRLWCTLDTLFPLLKLLLSFIRCEGTYVLRGPTDWSRFDFYAKRVKNFSYTRDPDHLDIALRVYFRIAQLRTSPILFPSLQHIHCPSISSNDFLISGICLFLSPSLVAVEIGEITIVWDFFVYAVK